MNQTLIDEKTPLISVVVTCFNSERYITQTIESVLANAREDLPIEVVVVNDCSTDRTVELVKRFGERIRLIDKPVNEGVSRARNTGIDAARGEYVAFCDHDDLWEPEKLRLQLDRFTRPEIGLVCTDALSFSDEGKVLIPSMAGPHLRRGKVFAEIIQQNFIITSSVMMRRAVLRSAGLFAPEITHSEDLDLWLRVTRLCEVDYVNQVLVRYRSSPSQLSSSKLKMKASRTQIIKRYAALLEDQRVAHRAIGVALFNYGMDYWWDRDMPQARKKLAEALRYQPFDYHYWLRYIGTFISPELRARLAKLKRASSRSPGAAAL